MCEQFPPTTPAADVALGCGLTVVFHMIAIVVMLGFLFSTNSSVVENITTGFLLALGVSQVVYMGPAIYYAYRRGRPNIGKGLLIGAAITLALTAACWTLFGGFMTGGTFR